MVSRTPADRVVREVGARVKAARQAAGLTQEEAAASAGIDYERYQRIEQGTINVTVRTLVRVARACRTDFWKMLGSSS